MSNSLQTVPFYQDSIFIIEHNGKAFVPVKPICENTGLNWAAQFTKIKAKSKRFSVAMIATQLPGDNQRREVVCIPLEKLFGWLCSIEPSKVAPHLKEKIELYQDECDQVLNNYWTKGVAATDHQLQNKILVDQDTYVEMTSDLYARQQNDIKKLEMGQKKVSPEESRSIKDEVIGGLSIARTAMKFGRSEATVKRHTTAERAARRLETGVKQMSLFGREV